MFDLHGKKALVTGSSQGIGQEMALCLAARGAEVYAHGSSSREKVDRVTERMTRAGGAGHTTVANLADPKAPDSLYAQTGDVDILICNASYQLRKPWDQITGEEFDAQLQVNLKATLRLIQLYAPAMMRRRWGRVVTVGSIQQVKPHPQMLAYAATKEGQMSLTRNLAKQLSPYGVTVNNLSPGTILTPRNSGVLENEDYRAACEAGIPCGYIGAPEDLNGAALLLCSEEGRYINGIDLLVDGGMHL